MKLYSFHLNHFLHFPKSTGFSLSTILRQKIVDRVPNNKSYKFRGILDDAYLHSLRIGAFLASPVTFQNSMSL
ncbi:hypothetical protein ATE92_2232 [Ulvibacter sp. MAR_2010_11]|nr:hypothetical protein ATE92_2232 [Ulvibacter sp. MAR_2010_11]